MDNKTLCPLVQDLLPSLADGIASPESERLMREHMETCKECRDMFADMCPPEDVLSQEMEGVFMEKFIRKWKIRKLFFYKCKPGTVIILTVHLLRPHMGRANPKTTLAVQSFIDHHGFQSLGMLRCANETVKIAFEMAVNTGYQFHKCLLYTGLQGGIFRPARWCYLVSASTAPGFRMPSNHSVCSARFWAETMIRPCRT